MNDSGFILIASLCIIAMAGGLLIRRAALKRYAGPGWNDAKSLDPRKWKPIWRMQGAFTDPRGYRLFVLAALLIAAGAVGALIVGMVR
jgi:hypothetical protein